MPSYIPQSIVCYAPIFEGAVRDPNMITSLWSRCVWFQELSRDQNSWSVGINKGGGVNETFSPAGAYPITQGENTDVANNDDGSSSAINVNLLLT